MYTDSIRLEIPFIFYRSSSVISPVSIFPHRIPSKLHARSQTCRLSDYFRLSQKSARAFLLHMSTRLVASWLLNERGKKQLGYIIINTYEHKSLTQTHHHPLVHSTCNLFTVVVDITVWHISCAFINKRWGVSDPVFPQSSNWCTWTSS